MNYRPALLSTAIAALLTAAPSNASSPMGPQNIPQRAEIPVSQHAVVFFIQRFQHDLESTEHTYDITAGPARENALRSLYLGWQARLDEFDTATLSPEDRIDDALFRRELSYRLSQLDFERTRNAQALTLLPEVAPLIALAEQRRALMPLDAGKAKRLIDRAASALKADESRLRGNPSASPVIALRERLLPPSPRITNIAQSALDFSWMDRIDTGDGVFITAEGLLMYLQPEEAMALIGECAARFPGGQMFFDLPPTIVKKVAPNGLRASKHYRVPPMPFSLSINQLRDLIGKVPGLKTVRDVPMPAGRGFMFKTAFPAFWDFGPMKPFRGVYALLEFA